jgi:hypothetical protein
MNPLFPVAMILAAVFFRLGQIGHRRWRNRNAALRNKGAVVGWLLAGVLALPAVVYAFYYSRLMGEPVWLYSFRSLPLTELLGSGIGFLAGWLQSTREESGLLKKHFGVMFFPLFFGFVVTVPFLKPLLRPLDWSEFRERWNDGVCLQSTLSSCGPASAATLLKLKGKPASEAALARECFSYAGGTENWYLARAFHRRGFSTKFLHVDVQTASIPSSSIAGVRIQGRGHFIAILGTNAAGITVGDPLFGTLVMPQAELVQRYNFTGFFLVIQ